MGGNVDKWREAFRHEEGWNNRTYQAIQRAEAPLIAGWLKGTGLDRMEILELGCGNGLLASLLCRWLAKEGIDFSYRVTDLLPEAVDSAREKFRDFPQPERISFQSLDIHDLVKDLGPASQSLIVSTGHASAASYRWAVPLVAESLKPGGTLIYFSHNIKSLHWYSPYCHDQLRWKMSNCCKAFKDWSYIVEAGVYTFYGSREFVAYQAEEPGLKLIGSRGFARFSSKSIDEYFSPYILYAFKKPAR